WVLSWGRRPRGAVLTDACCGCGHGRCSERPTGRTRPPHRTDPECPGAAPPTMGAASPERPERGRGGLGRRLVRGYVLSTAEPTPGGPDEAPSPRPFLPARGARRAAPARRPRRVQRRGR